MQTSTPARPSAGSGTTPGPAGSRGRRCVGGGVPSARPCCPASEVAFLARHLFSGPDGTTMTERIDRRIDLLPGLSGLRLTTGAAERLIAA